MAGFIEELYGNLEPQARGTKSDTEVRKEMQSIYDLEEELTQMLTGEEKKKFLAYANAGGVVNGESNLDSFIIGFQYGAAFMHDTFLSSDAPYIDFLKRIENGKNIIRANGRYIQAGGRLFVPRC